MRGHPLYHALRFWQDAKRGVVLTVEDAEFAELNATQ